MKDVNINIDVDSLLRKIKFSWLMKALGLAAVTLGVIQGFHEPSFLAGAQDTKLWLALIAALQGFFGKANTEHGTPDNPITPEAAAIVAATAAAPVLPSSSPGTAPNRY